MTPKWIEDLEALEKAATPGPWKDVCCDVIIPLRDGTGHKDDDFILALRNRAPQILRALRAAAEMREKNISDCDAGEDCGPCNNCGVCRWDAAMADAGPDATATTEEGEA